MSIADHFQHAPDAGFIRDYDSGSARRQFKVSLALVVLVALAASMLGFVIRFDSSARESAVGSYAPQVPAFAGKLQARN